MKMLNSLPRTAIALALCSQAAFSFASEAIMFDPDGAGPAPAISLSTLDWLPNSALSVNGNPSGGLALGDIIHLLAHARLGVMIASDGSLSLVPGGSEITFVAGFAEMVNTLTPDGSATTASFLFDGTAQLPNFFEIWVGSPADSNPLNGTGYNNSKRIMFGVVTDSSGNYRGGPPIVNLDQFGPNNYSGIRTISGSGSTQLSGVIVSADPDYFPGLTQAQIDNLKVFFNTSTVTPYKQTNPSKKFIGNSAGALGDEPQSFVNANIGSINGGLQFVTDLNFILQADSNQSFEEGEVVEGACRVTYGGNDRNGNVDPAKFGGACSSNPDQTENCYTFGGQVGAPTANPNFGGPFGEHTHHQTLGPAGDFIFRAGTHSAPDETRITATVCKDPGAIQPAAANAGFKQIDFEGTGSFRTLDDTAKAYLIANGGPADIGKDNVSDKVYYFRVDMVDSGEPGNQADPAHTAECSAFFAADQNNPLATADPFLLVQDGGVVPEGNDCADVYQLLICKDENPCATGQGMYEVRAFLTGGNIQLHKVVK